MRSPLTETIKRVEGMIAYVRENLDEGEYDLFLDLILPEPEPVKTAKKGRKKSSKSSWKSSRASGMAAAIKDSLEKGRQASQSIIDAANDPRTVADRCAACGNDADYQDHFQPSPHYHEFDAGKSSTSAAQPARGKSSTNGGAGSGTVNSETEKEDVSNAHHAGG